MNTELDARNLPDEHLCPPIAGIGMSPMDALLLFNVVDEKGDDIDMRSVFPKDYSANKPQIARKDCLIFPDGTDPGSPERVELLRTQYEQIMAAGEEVSPFEGDLAEWLADAAAQGDFEI